MSSKKHKRCKETCQPDMVEGVPISEKVPERIIKTPFLLFLILVLLIIVFGKEKIVAAIKMMMAGNKNEEVVVG